jgi:hypothetical protein
MSCARAVTLEQPATVDLALIFEYLGIRVTSYEETSLTANQVRCLRLICIRVCGVVQARFSRALQLRSEMVKRRKTWPTTTLLPPSPTPIDESASLVTLSPLQVRTFLCDM